ncbi:hypothetical protein BD311DRAFT_811809 [Dichomitus squalens]|uniref:Uncharacterized protein n=1 Tax=Dichomitus squalens TaxID=114155 RepID=A0A4V2JYQ8_9APHY|nr:hypothetical protein BD311DRAFT_811809 [Dichomitus squalens]
MCDVIQDYINHLNVDWEKKTSKSITRSDIHVRFAPNINPETDCDQESLGDFYDTHLTVEHRGGYFGKVP